MARPQPERARLLVEREDGRRHLMAIVGDADPVAIAEKDGVKVRSVNPISEEDAKAFIAARAKPDPVNEVRDSVTVIDDEGLREAVQIIAQHIDGIRARLEALEANPVPAPSDGYPPQLEDALKVLKFLTETMQKHEKKLAEQDLKAQNTASMLRLQVRLAVEIMDLPSDPIPDVKKYKLFAKAYDLTPESTLDDWSNAVSLFKQDLAA